jgi:uncharacterized protein (DUF58 family)
MSGRAVTRVRALAAHAAKTDDLAREDTGDRAVLTGRGRWILALGVLAYVAAWLLGSRPLYPVALGLVLAVALAAIWVRLFRRPVRLRRDPSRREHLAGDDVEVTLQLDAEERLPPGPVVLEERVGRAGHVEAVLRRTDGRLQGGYLLPSLPRGRYQVDGTRLVVEDPFGLARLETALPEGDAILVYPRLEELGPLFSDSGAHQLEGRRLLMRRPSGFDLHSVREYQDGESLRRVHWASTAKRGRLMVKELEDAPRDETVVLLDAEASAVVGAGPTSTFELQVRCAGSILRSFARSGRRAVLLVSGAHPHVQRVHSGDGDWLRAYEVLAAVEPDGSTPASAILAEESGPAARSLELTVVTAAVTPRLVDQLVQRARARHAASLVYVDPASFGGFGRTSGGRDITAQLLRLQRGGVPVAVVRRGDDLAERLGAPLPARAAPHA